MMRPNQIPSNNIAQSVTIANAYLIIALLQYTSPKNTEFKHLPHLHKLYDKTTMAHSTHLQHSKIHSMQTDCTA